MLYHARLHPEQYSNTFSDEQMKRLHDAIMYVCNTAIEANADADLFPEDWLMKHRWSKGKKDGSKLPNGAKITFVKVGGRTSAMVPSVQKKTAAVAGDVSEGAMDEESEEAEDVKPKKAGKRKATAVNGEEEEDELDAGEERPAPPKRGRKKVEVKAESNDTEEEAKPASKKHKTTIKEVSKKGKTTPKEEIKSDGTSGRRRSGRLSK